MEKITVIGNKDFSKFVTFEHNLKTIVERESEYVLILEDDSSCSIEKSELFQGRMDKDFFEENYKKDKEGFWYVRDVPEVN